MYLISASPEYFAFLKDKLNFILTCLPHEILHLKKSS